MQTDHSPSTSRVLEVLRRMGYDVSILEFREPTRTAEEAARRAGCSIGQIVKSLVFRGAATGKAVLVLTSGANRVDEESMAVHIGEAIKRADPEFVLSATGFAIGGVPPVGHTQTIESYLDEDLLQFESVWASAGAENAIFSISPSSLRSMTNARVVRVKP